MRARMRTIGCLGGMAWLATAQTTPPPLEFKGVRLGASMRSIQALFPVPLDCTGEICFMHVKDLIEAACPSRTPARSSCTTEADKRFGFGPAAVEEYVFYARDDRLRVVSFDYRVSDYEPLVAAVTLKYGAPTATRLGKAPAGANGRESRETEWTLPDGHIKLRERAHVFDKRTYGDGTLSTTPPSAEEKQREVQDAAKRL